VRKTTAIVASTIGVLVLLLSGCSDPAPVAGTTPNGIQDLKAYPAFSKGSDATKAAVDVTARGTIGSQNKKSKITLQKGGPNARATVTGPTESYEVISVPGFLFVKTSPKAWTRLVGAENAKQIQGRWVVSSSQGQLESFSRFVDVGSFFRASGRIKKGPVTDVNGFESLSIIDPSTNTDSTWWFAINGEPLLQRYRSGPFTRLDFSYNVINAITPPNKDDIIDIASIQEGVATPSPTPSS